MKSLFFFLKVVSEEMIPLFLLSVVFDLDHLMPPFSCKLFGPLLSE